MAPTFARRFFARLLDELIGVMIVVEVGGLFVILRDIHPAMIPAGVASAVIAYILYTVLLETGSRQATLGKQMLGLRICNAQGGTITAVQSISRLIVRWTLSTTLLLGGYLLALVTKRKQALHDLTAGTFVIRL